MAYDNEVLEVIETAARFGSSELDLSFKNLTFLPPQVAKLPDLIKLNLSGNALTEVPIEITRLTYLTSLDVSSNQLTSLQPQIGKLISLTSLNVSLNQLTSLPPQIGELINLTNLNVSSNQLTSLPPQIGKLVNLRRLSVYGNRVAALPSEISSLTKLEEMNLSDNGLTSAPPEIFKLTTLSRLYLWGNLLTTLPPELADMANLREITLGQNHLEKLPSAITKLNNLVHLSFWGNGLVSLPPEICKLTQLTQLDLPRNQLTSLPPELFKLVDLDELDLSGNQLTALPPQISNLKKLTSLRLINNQLTSLPPEITQLTNLTLLALEQNPLPIPAETLDKPTNISAIFAAIEGLETGERLNEAKVLVVGDGKVGKSSIVERLIYGTFNPRKQTTLGVEIDDEMNIVQSEVRGAGEPIKLNIWDFGGQEIQHSTHQFFLTTRSLYLVVVDARKGDQIGNIEYWLKLIESFGGDSPIIIVVNQIDQLKGQRELNLDRNALKAKYNIRDFIATSCETAEGILELKAAISREVTQMKHVHDIWPREWLAVKRRLKEMHADYIPVEKYFEICGEEKLDEADLRDSLLEMLHVLGTVIRFPGDTQVLNPRWVTQGVYGLLTSAQLVNNQGQFYLKDVGKILSVLPQADHYPAHTHQRLIDVMKHFQLCFEFTDSPGHYLIPRHLHDTEPDTTWNDNNALRFQYHYVETLPDSIISRFIVRMSQFIQKRNYWKNGVFLESGENHAKIKADLVDRKIFISITGKEQTRRAFLAIIRAGFNEINSNFKIEIKQMIPVPGFPEVLVSYLDLLAYEEENEPQIFIPELRKKFSVRELLDGVEDLSTRIGRRERDSSPDSRKAAIKPNSKRRTLRLVVASPGDVQAERDVLPSVVEEINRYIAARGLSLELTRWETDTHPGFHAEGPQGLIDPILRVADCDLLIGIFWKRFGTPTADGKTGTEHEFSQAYESWKNLGRPQILVYFNQKAYTPKSKAEAEQWGQVLDFRERFPKEGLWWPYRGKAQFEKLVRNHLMNYINSLN